MSKLCEIKKSQWRIIGYHISENLTWNKKYRLSFVKIAREKVINGKDAFKYRLPGAF